MQVTIPIAQLAEIRQNSRQETDTGHPEAALLDPTVTANGSTTSQPLLCSPTSNVPAVSKQNLKLYFT